MEARDCKTRAAKLVNAVSRAIGAASRRQPMEALSDQALARERHWSATPTWGALQVDCGGWTGKKSSEGGHASRDGVQRRMKGSYGYSVSRNTRHPFASHPGGHGATRACRGTSPRSFP